MGGVERDKVTIASGVFSRAAAMLFVLASILWPEGAVAGEPTAGRPSTAPKTIQTEGSCGGVVLHRLADGNAPLVLKARRADLATQALIKKIQGPFKVTSTLVGLANDMDSGMYLRHLVFLNRNPDWKSVLGPSRAGRVQTLIGRSRYRLFEGINGALSTVGHGLTALALAEQSRQALEGNDQAKLQAVATAAGVWQGWLVGKIGSKPLGLALVATSVFDVALNSWIQKVQYKYKEYWWIAYKRWTTQQYPNITLGELGTRWIDVIEDERVDGTKDERTEKTRKQLHEFWKNARINAYQIHGEERPFVSDANAIARFKEEFAARYFNDVLKTGDYNPDKRGLVEYYKIQARSALGEARSHAVEACRALLEKRKDLEALEAAIAWARKGMATEADPGQLREALEALAACDMARADALIARLPVGRDRARLERTRQRLEERRRKFGDTLAQARRLAGEGKIEAARGLIGEVPPCQEDRDEADALLAELARPPEDDEEKPPEEESPAVTVDEALVQRIREAIGNCEVERSGEMIAQLPEGDIRSALEAERVALQQREQPFMDAYGLAENLGKGGRTQEALDQMQRALGLTQCGRYRARAEAVIAELERELAARDLAAEAETAIKECRFKSAGALIDQLPGGQKATELRQRLANGRAHEATTKSLYDSGRALLKAGKSAEAIGQFKEAKAHTHCARLATTIDAAIARAEAWARDRGLHDQAMAAIRGCRFKEAKTLIGKIGQESTRTAAQAAFDQAAASEKRTNALFKEGNAFYKDGKYQTALDKLRAARDNTACARYRSRIDQALATVRAAAEQSRTPAAPTDAARSICRDSLPGSVPYMLKTGSFECGCADPMVINRAGNACRLGRQGQMAQINCTGGRTPDWNSDAERAVCACPGKNQRWDGRRCASAVQTAPATGGAAAGADPVADMLGNILGGMLGQVPGTPGAPSTPGTGTDRLGNILGGVFGQVPGAPGAAGGHSGGGAPGGGASSTECRRIMEDMARILREMQARGRPTSSAEDERLGRLYIQKHLRLCDRADRARCDFGNQRANNKFYTMCRNFRRGRLY